MSKHKKTKIIGCLSAAALLSATLQNSMFVAGLTDSGENGTVIQIDNEGKLKNYPMMAPVSFDKMADLTISAINRNQISGYLTRQTVYPEVAENNADGPYDAQWVVILDDNNQPVQYLRNKSIRGTNQLGVNFQYEHNVLTQAYLNGEAKDWTEENLANEDGIKAGDIIAYVSQSDLNNSAITNKENKVKNRKYIYYSKNNYLIGAPILVDEATGNYKTVAQAYGRSAISYSWDIDDRLWFLVEELDGPVRYEAIRVLQDTYHTTDSLMSQGLRVEWLNGKPEPKAPGESKVHQYNLYLTTSEGVEIKLNTEGPFETVFAGSTEIYDPDTTDGWDELDYTNRKFIMDIPVDLGPDIYTRIAAYRFTQTFPVTYQFVAEDGSELPQTVLDLLPESYYGDVGETVKADKLAKPAQTVVPVENGAWMFLSWNRIPFRIDEDKDLNIITGTWRFIEKQYKATYRYETEDGSELPQEILTLVPKDMTSLKSGEVVQPSVPRRNTITIGDTKWRFVGYQENEVTVSNEDIVFVGTWKIEETTTTTTSTTSSSTTSTTSTEPSTTSSSTSTTTSTEPSTTSSSTSTTTSTEPSTASSDTSSTTSTEPSNDTTSTSSTISEKGSGQTTKPNADGDMNGSTSTEGIGKSGNYTTKPTSTGKNVLPKTGEDRSSLLSVTAPIFLLLVAFVVSKFKSIKSLFDKE